jgi:single-stranded-DNA-specific exonuclease
VVLISTRDGMGRGSARSIPGINLHEMLKACAMHLESFGGHATAAGLRIKARRIDAFQNALAAAISKASTPEDFIPLVHIDGELNFADISPELLEALESLKPYGTANPEPLFMAQGVSVVSSKIVGKKHRKMTLIQPANRSARAVDAIHFNADHGLGYRDFFDRVAFRLRWNRWNGRKTVQLVVEEI